MPDSTTLCLAVTVLNPRIATLYLECSRSDKVDTWWGMLSVRVRVRFRVRVRVKIRGGGVLPTTSHSMF